MADDRFAHLLQPIRDLAENWSIDISSELEEYLEVLEGITFSFEGGPSLNFAEAALLIQGSACVYSKKVEYLHSLVYQALEFVAERKRKDQRANDVQKAAGAADEDNEFDDEEQFLSLDDTLEEGEGIDLEEEDLDLPFSAPTRLPDTLLALEATDGAGQGEHDISRYRIASCSIHHSGALLLEARDGDILDERLEPITAPTLLQRIREDASELANENEPGQPLYTTDGVDMNDDDYDDNGGDYGYMPEDDHVPMDEGAMPIDDGMQQQMMRSPNELGGSGEEQQALGIHQGRQLEELEESFFDPYAPLDPADRSSVPSKPFKRFTRLPNRPRTSKQSVQVSPTDALLAPAPPVNGPVLAEFQYAWDALQRAKAQSRRAAQTGALAAATATNNAELASAFTLEEAAGMPPEDEYYDDGNMFDDGGAFMDEDDALNNSGPAETFLPDGFDLDKAGWEEATMAGFTANGTDRGVIAPPDAATAEELTYEELCRAHIDAFISAAAASEVQTELAARVSGWRNRMEPVLEEEDARPEFDIKVYGERIIEKMAVLSVDVDDDTTTAAETRKSSKGSKKHKESEASPKTVFEFGDVVAEVDNMYEISRTFSSMLQLINAGNIGITPTGDESGSFTLTLLKKTLAPSGIPDIPNPAADAINNAKTKTTMTTTTTTTTPDGSEDEEEGSLQTAALSPLKTNQAAAGAQGKPQARAQRQTKAATAKRRKA